MKIQDFKDLVVWQKAKRLAVLLYRVTKKFPRNEQFGLISQLQRAVISVPSNIAEGHSRQHTKEFIQFLYVALGSAAELETQLAIAQELGYLAFDDYNGIIDNIKEIQKMLNGLINSLKRKSNHE